MPMNLLSVSSHPGEPLYTSLCRDRCSEVPLPRNYPVPQLTHTSAPGCPLPSSHIHLPRHADEQHEFPKGFLLWEDVYLPQPPFP